MKLFLNAKKRRKLNTLNVVVIQKPNGVQIKIEIVILMIFILMNDILTLKNNRKLILSWNNTIILTINRYYNQDDKEVFMTGIVKIGQLVNNQF